MSDFKDFVKDYKKSIKAAKNKNSLIAKRAYKNRGRNDKQTNEFSTFILSRTSSVSLLSNEFGISKEIAKTIKTKAFFRYARREQDEILEVVGNIYNKFGVLPTKFKDLVSYINGMLPYEYSRFVILNLFNTLGLRIVDTTPVVFGEEKFKDVIKNKLQYSSLMTKKDFNTLYTSQYHPEKALTDVLMKRYGIGDHFYSAVERIVIGTTRSSDEVMNAYLRIISKFEKPSDIHIIDYLRFVGEEEVLVAEKQGIARIRYASDAWHDMMQMAKLKNNVTWPTSFQKKSFPLKSENGIVVKSLVIEPITSAKELSAEGRRMKHCVYSYVQACVSHRSEIFRVYIEEFELNSYLSTVEYNNVMKKVVQHRGKLNSKPSSLCEEYVKRYFK